MKLEAEAIKKHEAALQQALTVWILSGLAFMLLPGTFLGAWNLIEISSRHAAGKVDPTWIQAHGHAQIFGWIGSFIMGIGFYSLSKAGNARFAIGRAWTSWGLWSGGVLLRWITNLWQWEWRWMLPLSALLELSAFVIFVLTVSRHRTADGSQSKPALPVWMVAVITGTAGFFFSLAANLALAVQAAVSGGSPATPHAANQRMLALFTWAFPVVIIWGFSARWLPVFLGLRDPAGRLLMAALAVNLAAVAGALGGWWLPATVLFTAGAALSVSSLRVFTRSIRPPKTTGVHPAFPVFVRLGYGWLLAAALLSIAAACWDTAGGLWGASRHALTVGFMATMVFAIGQRILPAFCGMRILYSPTLMLAGLVLLNAGCLLRVISEAGAYEEYLPAIWPLLPVSAILEMAAVSVFAVNLLLTFRQPPAHLARQ